MERIIINEVDNTSNVEVLSSYDVVYVPGFANGPDDVINQSLFRVPTLVRDKYEFARLYGNRTPVFTQPQPWPEEFPTVAKKWGGESGVYYSIQVNNFSSVANIVDSGFYSQINALPFDPDGETVHYFSAASTPSIDGTVFVLSNMASEDFNAINTEYYGLTVVQAEKPAVEGTVYYVKSGGGTAKNPASIIYTQTPNNQLPESDWTGVVFTLTENQDSNILDADSDPTTFYTKTEADEIAVYTQVLTFDTKLLFASTISPAGRGWYEITDAEYELTSDSYITLTNDYYGHEDGVSYMFEGPSETYQGDGDPGYRYAYALLSMGIPVYYEQMNSTRDEINVQMMYTGLVNRFLGVNPDPADTTFDSVGDYSVKFITSGGYPVFEYDNNDLAAAMIEMASARADSIALIDHTDNPERDLTVYSDDSVISVVREWQPANGTHGAMFTPWYECSAPGISTSPDGTETFTNINMPGSFAYLTALAVQVKNYNPWLAVAGVTRGLVPYCNGLHTNKPLTNNIADSYQALPGDVSATTAICINPITYIRNYGNCIWGNRTLRNNSAGTKASSFLNIRSAVSDIKKRLYEASQRHLFDQNTDVTWLNFKSLIEPLLETMVSDYILADYSIARLFTDPNTGYAVPAYEVMAVIRIQPINSIEVFDLTVYLENTDEFSLTTTEVEVS